jgi:G3E family GTPase
VDGPAFEFSWQERKALIIGHITDADLVVVSRSDLVKKEKLGNIKKILKEYVNGIIGLSTNRDFGVAEVMEKLD